MFQLGGYQQLQPSPKSWSFQSQAPVDRRRLAGVSRLNLQASFQNKREEPDLANEEVWKPIPGYDGRYEASSLGRIRSKDWTVSHVNGSSRLVPGRIIKGGVASNGYRMVSLTSPQGQNSFTVHNLVLTTFRGPRPEGHVGCHWDGDKLNNLLENLRWDTYANNLRDSVRQGVHWGANKDSCPRGHKLSGANLRVRSDKPAHIRECKACHRAVADCRRRGIPFSKKVADEKYFKIMEEELNESGQSSGPSK